MTNKDDILIILCTYKPNINYFDELIHSLHSQTFKRFSLSIHDDGSDNKTIEDIINILLKYKLSYSFKKNSQKMGHSKNFIYSLIKSSDEYNYFAFCDQDDIWHPTKIEVAIKKLETVKESPSLYCCRSRLINSRGSIIGYSPIKLKQPSFGNALVQSLAAGHTMIMNKASLQVLKKTSADINVIAHDWWTYIILSGVGGNIIFDHDIYIDYRLHSENTVGTSFSFISKLKRLKQLVQGQYKKWNNLNIHALKKSLSILSSNNKEIFIKFEKLRNESIFLRNYRLYSLRINRHNLIQTIILHLAVLFKRI
jgi:glycosyltransferase involved in cell wall biosynthesis